MIIEQIKKDQLAARKAGNKIATKALTSVISDSTGAGVNAGVPTDETVIAVIRKHLKGLNETAGILDVKDPRHQDTLSEMAILNAYLPQSLTDQEISKIVMDLMIAGNSNIGMFMGAIKKVATAEGKLFDGAQAQRVIKSLV